MRRDDHFHLRTRNSIFYLKIRKHMRSTGKRLSQRDRSGTTEIIYWTSTENNFATNEYDVPSANHHWPIRPTKGNNAMHPWESYWKDRSPDRCRRSTGAVHGSVRHGWSSEKWNCGSVSFQNASLFWSAILRWCEILARSVLQNPWYRRERGERWCSRLARIDQ